MYTYVHTHTQRVSNIMGKENYLGLSLALWVMVLNAECPWVVVEEGEKSDCLGNMA